MKLNLLFVFIAASCAAVVQAAPVETSKHNQGSTPSKGVVGGAVNGVADVAKTTGEKVRDFNRYYLFS